MIPRKASYTEAAMAAQKVDGKVYGSPKAVETTEMFFTIQ